MTRPALTMAQLLDEAGLSAAQSTAISAALAAQAAAAAERPPLYLRILTGFGAWVAALFVILFMAMIDLLDTGLPALAWGLVFLAAGIFISRVSRAVFHEQLALALVMAGNLMVLFGGVDLLKLRDELAVLVIHGLVCLIVSPLFANAVYRFLAPIGLAVLATFWLVETRQFVLIHPLLALETLLAGGLLRWTRRPAGLTPLAYAAAATLPGTLLFLHFTQKKFWRIGFSEPLWPSSLLLALGLSWVYLQLAGGFGQLRRFWLWLAILATWLLGVFTTPGILVVIGLLLFGEADDDRLLKLLAYLFLPAFLWVYYYALHIDLATKSYLVAGSGLVLLAVRGLVCWLERREVTP